MVFYPISNHPFQSNAAISIIFQLLTMFDFMNQILIFQAYLFCLSNLFAEFTILLNKIINLF
jgi:hypothetical protein